MAVEFSNSDVRNIEIEGVGPERIRARVFRSADEASMEVASIVAAKIKKRASEGRMLVLGLPTGSTPVPFFRELCRYHVEEGLSFSNLICFQLDEYYQLPEDSIHSYANFLRREFYSQVDVAEENIHSLDGNVEEDELYNYCAAFETKIAEVGGIDIQLLGVGRSGHVGFNEPGSPASTTTRAVTLDKLTRIDAAEEFLGLERVPAKALTMGIETIMKARKIIIMAWGKAKAQIVKDSIEGDVTPGVPPTILQHHSNSFFFLDIDSAEGLTRFNTPWLVGPCRWDDRLIRKAVVWLCLRVDKPVLKLTDRHYYDNGLGDLLTKRGPSNRINIKVFNDLQHTITGWPGGKPNVEDHSRPERRQPYPKRVVVFSPHPDDDVISMGGTLSRLVVQNHDVHVAYQTSGNMAVADEYILKYLHFLESYEDVFDLPGDATGKINSKLKAFLAGKHPEQIDSPEIRKLKGLVRRGEAVAACGYFGISEDRLHFLDLPFYETGAIEKRPPGEADIEKVEELLQRIRPHQIFAAGDLADPHGTHKVCIEIVLEALARLKSRNESWLDECWLWLYRGAWQEWELDKVDMAVPISPDELAAKTTAILKHTSQKDGALFMGEDHREFWQRAEDRNRATAQLYDKLGMAEYEAFEVFVRSDY